MTIEPVTARAVALDLERATTMLELTDRMNRLWAPITRLGLHMKLYADFIRAHMNRNGVLEIDLEILVEALAPEVPASYLEDYGFDWIRFVGTGGMSQTLDWLQPATSEYMTSLERLNEQMEAVSVEADAGSMRELVHVAVRGAQPLIKALEVIHSRLAYELPVPLSAIPAADRVQRRG